jgi:hypothetical protein
MDRVGLEIFTWVWRIAILLVIIRIADAIDDIRR